MKCPLCESRETTLVKTNMGGSPSHPAFGVGNLECRQCGFVFSDFIHPQVLDYFYTYYCRHGTSAEGIEDIRENARAGGESQLKTMQPFLPEKVGRILDFGGGHGETARLFLPYSDEVYIVEQDPVCIEHIKKEPCLNLITGDDLTAEEYIGFFDLVILSNVLEHLTFPIRQVQFFSRILDKDGLFFVEVPSESEFLKKSTLQMPQHINFFSPATFKSLIGRQGSFDFVDFRTCGPSIDDMVAARSILHDFGNQNNPNGWVIRALLKNSRPKLDVIEMNIDMEDCEEILASLSEYLFRSADTFR